jgi:anti-sigma factor RsiW
MQVTRDVILDLAPAYLTGEASSDTRALVDAYLAGDPELAAWMADQHRHTFAPLEDTPPLELETRTLRRTRRRIAVQRWLFGLGCFFVALSLSLEFTTRNGRVVEFHFLARDYPLQAAICVAVAVLFWSAYAALRRNRL